MSAGRRQVTLPSWALILAAALTVGAIALAGYVTVRHLPAASAAKPAPTRTYDPAAFVAQVRHVYPDSAYTQPDDDGVRKVGTEVCAQLAKYSREDAVAVVKMDFGPMSAVSLPPPEVQPTDAQADQIVSAAQRYLC